jgi:hypothetical protein
VERAEPQTEPVAEVRPVETRAEPRPEPRHEPRPEPRPAPAPVAAAPKVDPKEVLADSGLVMIETDRARAPQQPVPEEPQQLGRPRRERPTAAAQDDSLVQVETTRK